MRVAARPLTILIMTGVFQEVRGHSAADRVLIDENTGHLEVVGDCDHNTGHALSWALASDVA